MSLSAWRMNTLRRPRYQGLAREDCSLFDLKPVRPARGERGGRGLTQDVDLAVGGRCQMRSWPAHLWLALSPACTQNNHFYVVDECESFMSSVYLANFTKCSLIVPETRIIAGLLLQGVEPREWERQVYELNVLQKRTAKTAATYANLARARLQTMEAELWQLVHEGSMLVATHTVLAATIKFSPLFGDFLRTVVRHQFRRFSPHLELRHWDGYIEDCQRAQPDMPSLTDSTRGKLRQNAIRMLAEAGFIEDTRSLRLRSQAIEPDVLNYLRQHNEQYVLDCLQVCP